MDLNVTAPINSLGYGVVGVNVVAAMWHLGHCPALWPMGQVECPEKHDGVVRGSIRRTASYNRFAPSLRIWHQFDLAQHVGKSVHAALPIFELDKFTATECHHLNSQDLVFVASDWAKEVLVDNGLLASKIRVVPFGVDREIFFPVESTEQATHFINIGKWELRKGHDILIEAFEKAFTPKDNVLLTMLSHNPCFGDLETMRRYNEGWASRYKNSPMGEKISLYQTRVVTQQAVASLMGKADCGVFPARAEGWNLELAEMLAMGKHCITTDYAAHTQYATACNSLLIEVDELETAFDGVWFKGQGRWAALKEKQVDQLVAHLRKIHRLKQDGQLGINLNGISSMKNFTWDNAVRKIVESF